MEPERYQGVSDQDEDYCERRAEFSEFKRVSIFNESFDPTFPPAIFFRAKSASVRCPAYLFRPKSRPVTIGYRVCGPFLELAQVQGSSGRVARRAARLAIP